MFSAKMEGNVDTDLEINYLSEEASVGDKRKREGRLRSKVWQHFTKILKEDGTCGKCQCNHCQKLFTCSSRSGTTHLLRHITDGICPVFKKNGGKSAATVPIAAFSQISNLLPWGSPRQHCMDVEVEMDHAQHSNDYHTPPMQTAASRGKLPLQSRLKSKLPNGEAWGNEFRVCVGKLVELANGKLPAGLPHAASSSSGGPDYSVSAALKCLNEMEDVEQSSEMYLDAVEIMQDVGERECFICLPPEPRRRWLQRVLHRRNPLRYSSNM